MSTTRLIIAALAMGAVVAAAAAALSHIAGRDASRPVIARRNTKPRPHGSPGREQPAPTQSPRHEPARTVIGVEGTAVAPTGGTQARHQQTTQGKGHEPGEPTALAARQPDR